MTITAAVVAHIINRANYIHSKCNSMLMKVTNKRTKMWLGLKIVVALLRAPIVIGSLDDIRCPISVHTIALDFTFR